jgi:hypothetical protein
MSADRRSRLGDAWGGGGGVDLKISACTNLLRSGGVNCIISEAPSDCGRDGISCPQVFFAPRRAHPPTIDGTTKYKMTFIEQQCSDSPKGPKPEPENVTHERLEVRLPPKFPAILWLPAC